MRYVLDSCVAIKWLLPERDSAKAVQLRDEYQAGTHELISCDVLPIESAHALARAERRGILVPPEGCSVLPACCSRCQDSIRTCHCSHGPTQSLRTRGSVFMTAST